MSHLSSTARAVALTIAIGALAGCTAKARVESNRTAAYVQEPQRLFVFESLSSGGINMRRADFSPYLTAALQTCGIAVEIVTVPAQRTKALPLDVAADRIRSFQP